MRASRAVLALIASSALIAGCNRSAPADRAEEEERAVAVAARAVDTGTIRTVVRASAVVTPAEGAEFLVVAPEPARILEIPKAEGDTVAGAEVLARFELPSALEDVTRFRAELAAAEAQVENARRAQARAREFVARGLVPRVELDAADRNLAEAEDAATRARAAVARAEAAVARAVVRAPFDGIVAQRFKNPGDIATGAATDPVLRVVDPRRLEVTASVPVADQPRVLPGATARMTNPIDGRVLELRVTPRATAAPPHADGTVPVRLEFVEPINVPVNTRADVEIDAEERAGIVFVAPEAVIQDDGGKVVMVAQGERAERRTVTTGIGDAQRVEITSGLKPGELVITQGHLGLENGARITVAVADAQP